MKKRIFAVLMCSLLVLTACGNKGGETSNNSVNQVEDGASVDGMEGECFVTIVDGEESYDIPVSAYGDEIELPKPKGSKDGGEFVGWLSYTGLFAPGDKAISEEFMTYEAVYTSPNEGMILVFDSMGNGYSTNMSEGEDFIIDNPYLYDYSFNSSDFYIDYYVDQDGNRYDFDEKIKIGHGECLILTTVYSEDLNGAYKVGVSYNSPIDDLFDESNYRYVKMGESIPVESMIEYDGYTIEGWFDAPEGGNFVCANGESYTPSADIELFAHWNEN